MRPRFRTFNAARESAEELRAHTARLLHAATSGRSPLVGAKLGVSKARITNQIAGDCANPLELLYRWIDALEQDGVDAARLDSIARDFASRRGYDLAPRLRIAGTAGVVVATGAAAREIGEALAVALERAASRDEKVREVVEAMEALQALKAACEKEEQAAGVRPA